MEITRFKIEVIADQSGKWAGNNMVYSTFEEAKAAARDLASRWMLVTKARVVEFNPESNEVISTQEVF